MARSLIMPTGSYFVKNGVSKVMWHQGRLLQRLGKFPRPGKSMVENACANRRKGHFGRQCCENRDADFWPTENPAAPQIHKLKQLVVECRRRMHAP